MSDLSANLVELSSEAAPGPWHVDMFPYRDMETGEPQPPQCEGICTHDDEGGLANSIATCNEREAKFIVALVNAYRDGHLARASDAEHYLLLGLEKAKRIRQLSDELDLARDCLKRGDERDAEYAQLKAENARLREEWAQEGIGWLRDKDIDRLMGVEEENKRLRERLEDKTNSLRVEIAAKQGAHNEIRTMEMALRRAVRALDEGHIIRLGSQIYCDLMDALPEN